MARLIIVYNKSAGKASSSKKAIQDAFAPFNHKLFFVDIKDFQKHLKSVKKNELLVAAGGDGTVNAVAQAAVEHKMAMGVLPLGTLNHFAKDLGLPLDLAEAAAIISKRKLTKIDYCTVNGRIFVNNSSIGIYPRTVIQREKLTPKLGKWPAAFVGALQSAIQLHTNRLGFVMYHKRYVFRTPLVFIGNNSYQLEKVGFTNRSSLTKGKLFIYVVRANRLGSLIGVIAMVFLGKRPSNNDFLEQNQTKVSIQSHKKVLKVAIDGEVVSLRPPLNYEIHRAGLSICVLK